MLLTLKKNELIMIYCNQEQTIHELYTSTAKAALSKTMRMVNSLEIAEEIVQESYLKLWKKKLSFDDKKQAYTWIYKSCHNAAIDYLRSGKNKHEKINMDSKVYDFIQDKNITPLTHIESQECINILTKFLNKKELQIFLYIILDQMTHDEIAKIMNLSRRTIIRISQKTQQKLETYRSKSNV